ncbi:MAG: hypothetical protein CR993_07615 [Rhodobacterales bacterium]|nr:MAG: hypothetical protein CR993_07615 [Rhodobacterales bacterium]
MNTLDLALFATLAVAFAVLISGPMRRNQNWSAMVTPLASIIGSGFLVSMPLLAGALGIWAVAAVVGLTGLAYLFGGAIRYNIAHVEPALEHSEARPALRLVETASHLVLVGAYFISVAYYLVLLAAFGLKLVGLENPVLGKAIATTLTLGICGLGATRGLKAVEQAEIFTVGAKLAAIAALLVALLIFGMGLPPGYSWQASSRDAPLDWETIRFLMGMVIIVQGFETTRFMGQMYDADLRIKAMRRSQLTATVVYVVFFLLMIPLFPFFTAEPDVAGFIDVIGRVSPWLPYIVTAGAVASQFSAAVADSIGASGLVSDTTRNRVTAKHGYLLIGVVAVSLIWGTDVMSIVALASRAFALFYALQCVVAMLMAQQHGARSRAAWFGALGAVAFAIAIFGIPAE